MNNIFFLVNIYKTLLCLIIWGYKIPTRPLYTKNRLGWEGTYRGLKSFCPTCPRVCGDRKSVAVLVIIQWWLYLSLFSQSQDRAVSCLKIITQSRSLRLYLCLRHNLRRKLANNWREYHWLKFWLKWISSFLTETGNLLAVTAQII